MWLNFSFLIGLSKNRISLILEKNNQSSSAITNWKLDKVRNKYSLYHGLIISNPKLVQDFQHHEINLCQYCTMGQQVDMWPKNKISSKLPQIGSKLPQDNPVHENIVHTNNKQTQNELFMFEVGGLDGPEAILLETGKSGKTDKWIYLTSESFQLWRKTRKTWFSIRWCWRMY